MPRRLWDDLYSDAAHRDHSVGAVHLRRPLGQFFCQLRRRATLLPGHPHQRTALRRRHLGYIIIVEAWNRLNKQFVQRQLVEHVRVQADGVRQPVPPR